MGWGERRRGGGGSLVSTDKGADPAWGVPPSCFPVTLILSQIPESLGFGASTGRFGVRNQPITDRYK